MAEDSTIQLTKKNPGVTDFSTTRQRLGGRRGEGSQKMQCSRVFNGQLGEALYG